VNEAEEIIGRPEPEKITLFPRGIDETIVNHPAGRADAAETDIPATPAGLIVDGGVIPLIDLDEFFLIQD
jgi:hypothetical protein